jgi:hypothetical protein
MKLVDEEKNVMESLLWNIQEGLKSKKGRKYVELVLSE